MRARITRASLVTLIAVCVGAGGLLPRQVRGESAALQGVDEIPSDPIGVSGLAADDDRTLLRIRNRTPFIVIVYVGGVRIGWMRPHRVGLIRGLVPGSHQLFAQTRQGTASWGPRGVAVPGTWNLLY